jgi:hypothetical protein
MTRGRAGLALPAAPPPLVKFAQHLERILNTWRASVRVRALSPAQQAEMRLKVFALSVFRGLKREWGYRHTWLANYLAQPAINIAEDVFRDAVARLLAPQLLGTRVVFSAQGFKCGAGWG